MRTVAARLKEWKPQARQAGADAQPLRAELFSLEQLVRHAQSLAAGHHIFSKPGSNRLLARLNQNEKILKAFNRETEAVLEKRQITHAAEWLLDNFYLIEEQIQMARRHLPRGYSHELPRLLDGPSARLPRVYDIVLELISHVDAQIDIEPLSAFVASYQTVSPLKLGELWAVPIMLRLGLIENLQRVTSRLMEARHDRDLADIWVKRLQEVAEANPSQLVIVMAEMAKADINLSSSFVAEFCQHLARQSSVMHWVRNWLEQRLTEQGQSIEQLVHQESQMQAADQVTISHSITSLRFLASMDWREFVETMSQVDQVLRNDPADVYGDMDFFTRDRYRHVIEALARNSGRTETDVARQTVRLAEASAKEKGREARASHVGYYLIDKGQPLLEKTVGVRWPWRAALEKGILRFPMAFYAGGIFLLSVLGTGAFLLGEGLTGFPGWEVSLITAVLLLCFSQLAVPLLNLLSTLLVTPHLLPRLDYSEGIPDDCRTIVAVPTMLTRPEDVEHLSEALEIHYLANRDPALSFALLTDFADASQETLPEDGPLLELARNAIAALNKKYETGTPLAFLLFHRPRRWNKSEGCWMGYERKRGKLNEFNALLRGGAPDRFLEAPTSLVWLRNVKFVITLDTDTQLPRDAARQLVGTLAHPLNRPRFHPVKGIVTEGYGILQPRVAVSLPSSNRSWFVRLFAGDVGIDPYTRAASDVYQDVFGEGSFIGKGIYDVDAFAQTATTRFPENTVLSHDLIESCHARSALVSDIELYEDYPSRYTADISRRHRWMRGDWQIARWLFPLVPASAGPRIFNPLSALSLWKIFDNLRRSLVAPALMAFLLGGWLLFPGSGVEGPRLVIFIFLLPGVFQVLLELMRKPDELPLAMHLRAVVGTCGRQLAQVFLSLAFLPYEAFISLDAIIRTLWRLLVSGRHLLEWKTAQDAERTARTSLPGLYATMWSAPFAALAFTLVLAVYEPGRLAAALPLLTLWLLSPCVAWQISRPIAEAAPELGDKETARLRRIARKTWRFFETFVTERENWLPPDNFQEIPDPVIASRTSPTNIGLALLANLTARDFGHLSVGELIRRTQNTLATMQRLEKHRGHLYNWYDTRSLEPLRPLYVSSVDSGNLAGHLLTLGPGLAELIDQPLFAPHIFTGLHDTAALLQEQTDKNTGLEKTVEELLHAPASLGAGFALLQRLTEKTAGLAATQTDPEIKWWSQALERNARDHLDDLLFMAPWLGLGPLLLKQRGLPENLSEQLVRLDLNPTLRELAELDQSLCPPLQEILHAEPENEPLASLLNALRTSSDRASQRIHELETLIRQGNELAVMDFTFLFDVGRNLFSIGYSVEQRRCDASFYDLLASEARLCSYVAIAQGQVPQDHWFSLGRLLLASQGEPVLASWSGSLFEYLMPLLVMPAYENTLLDQTYKSAVAHQIDYGRINGIPWGISESGYNRTDVHHNYQYRAFGVPGLGLKRGLADDLVIAPYATAMALMVAPRTAYENLMRLAEDGREGPFGYYEAVDYTSVRLPPGQSSTTIRSYMAHHHGMSFLALSYLLHQRPMQRRFMGCPLFRATELLLQERVPKTAANVLADDWDTLQSRKLTGEAEGNMRVLTNPGQAAPEVHLLSNGRYHVAISSAGGGYSRWNDLAVTRWREDATRDAWGSFVYLRNVETGEFWSAAHQPVLRPTKGYEAIFTQGRAEFRQRHGGIEAHTELCVSPEDDVELRRITLTNHTDEEISVELTSYAEVVLATAAADAAHPAFSNLFVQTEFVSPGLLCTRRARSEGEKPPWLVHLLLGQGGEQGDISYETDRAKFVGRGHTLDHPAALRSPAPLSNTVGSVLDPIIALRRVVTLKPHETARVDFITGVAGTRESVLALTEKYNTARMADRVLELAWTHSQVTLRQLNVSEPEAQLYARLASSLIYASSLRRAAPSILLSNRRGQSGLWGYGISGDLPIVLLRISDTSRIEIVRQLIQAHAYWRMKGLPVDLVILNEDDSVYRQPLHDQIVGLIASGIEAQMLDKPGGIFVRSVDQVSSEDRILLQSVARIVLMDENGTLAEQMDRPGLPDPVIPPLTVAKSQVHKSPEPPFRELILHNGLGGFTSDGREYVINLQGDQPTPAPWVNVLANPWFGTLVSESGSAYTWIENCHEFRLTPWNNDPVSDGSGETFYIRDEQTGQFWSPTPLPARGTTPYVIRHGFGYTVFEHIENGIASELWIYVATDAPVKFAVLKLRNVSGVPRRISATGYWEWVLGELRSKNLLHIQTELDPKSGALLARNPYNTDFQERVAFVDVNELTRSYTGDRKEFLGRNGSPAQPAAMKRSRLSGKVGAGLDPCAAMQVAFDLPTGQEREISFRIGVGRNAADVQTLVQRFRRPDACRNALEEVWQYWNRTLGAVHVETPDPAVNVMANGWLLYQTLSCRMWARTGFYQSGGAFGFRDQLQDSMALVHSEPGLIREHLLRAASHQFREGDVQHWWHPPGGRGVRTHFSDDYLWLPYVTCRYVKCLADTGVLKEPVPFLEGRLLRQEEESVYDLPRRSEESGTLYQHCVRAIENGLKFGEHGLPLIGCGDWNDGMNMIGEKGKGESIWLAFFLYDVLTQFAEVARGEDDVAFATRCLAQAALLEKNIEKNAWDGEWYRRAYFDDGTPLGSHTNPECQIDSLPQSWSVLSGAGTRERSRQAMMAVGKRLVRTDDKLIQLFDPPFDHSDLNPGYIKGYIPGVRENGGQYTHAAIWTVMAFALQGEHDRAWDLFNMLNPARHGSTPEDIATYRVEPYVAAADVYGVAPHTGRGGWTWYTGSAGWMYRLVTETLLGLQREGDRLIVTPRLPKEWGAFKIHYRFQQTTYHLDIVPASPAPGLVLDGHDLPDNEIPLVDDGGEHTVEIRC